MIFACIHPTSSSALHHMLAHTMSPMHFPFPAAIYIMHIHSLHHSHHKIKLPKTIQKHARDDDQSIYFNWSISLAWSRIKWVSRELFIWSLIIINFELANKYRIMFRSNVLTYTHWKMARGAWPQVRILLPNIKKDRRFVHFYDIISTIVIDYYLFIISLWILNLL